MHTVWFRTGQTRLACLRWARDQGYTPMVKAPGALYHTLWAAAEQSSGRRFHTLFDCVCRGDVLWGAWFRVCKNEGAAGVDRVTAAAVEDYGVDRVLRELRHGLRIGRYRLAPARRVEIPKPRGAGELVRYADDGVVMFRSAAQAEHTLAAVGEIPASLGMRLHPEKTKVVDPREGREGLDFLGCHFRARTSGRCGNTSASCATTCTAGRPSGPWPVCGTRCATAPVATAAERISACSLRS